MENCNNKNYDFFYYKTTKQRNKNKHERYCNACLIVYSLSHKSHIFEIVCVNFNSFEFDSKIAYFFVFGYKIANLICPRLSENFIQNICYTSL